MRTIFRSTILPIFILTFALATSTAAFNKTPRASVSQTSACRLLAGFDFKSGCLEIVLSRIAVEYLTLRARVFTNASRFDEALANTDLAIQIAESRVNLAFTNRELADLFILRGQAELGLYEWDRSLEAYNTALEIAPDYAEIYFHRGVLYYSILQTGLSTREAALEDFEKYLEIAPEGQFADEAAAYATSIQQVTGALEDG